MKTISYKNTGYFSKTVIDYLSESDDLKPFYNLFPNIKNFKEQIEQKTASFPLKNRETLVKTLNKQYQDIEISKKTKENIALLAKENTFTVTTGHQLNLFSGPLYFLYKIISTINLCECLAREYPTQNFVPIYWMATEDHDFEEIQYFNFKNQKILWKRETQGAVGRLNTQGLEAILQKIKTSFGSSKNANNLIQLFEKSYIKHQNLTDATRYLTNELFKQYGLVILDADNATLKKEFISIIKDELLNQTAFAEINTTNIQLSKHYKIQVNPRKINLFYLKDNLRERIILKDKMFTVNNTKIQFTKEEILRELENFPERFSPNVIMRPLYQEVILPNLCYIGGGGELAYWLELNSYFEKENIPFPVLLLRNSALIMTKKQGRKLEKLNLSKEEIFLKQQPLINKKVKEKSNLKIDFSKQRNYLKEQFKQLKEIAQQTDKSFIGAVNAQEKKQLNGLNYLEKRLLKAEKIKLVDIVHRITLIQDELFPNQSLQERYTNFSEMYLEFGTDLIPLLKNNLKPLAMDFSIFEL